MSKFNILIKEKGLALVENWPERHDYIDDQHQDYIDAYNQLRESALSNAIDIAPESEDLVYKLLTKIDTSYGLPKTGLVYPIELDGKVEMFSNRDGHTQIAHFLPSETLNNNAPNSNIIERNCQNGCDWPNCTLPKCIMKCEQGAEGYVTAAAKILHALKLVIGQDVNEFAMPVLVQIMKNNISVSPPTDKSQEELWAKISQIALDYTLGTGGMYTVGFEDEVMKQFEIRKINQ